MFKSLAKSLAIAALLTAAIPVTTLPTVAQPVASLEPGEQSIHYCWASSYQLSKVKWRQGRNFEARVNRIKEKCIKARKHATAEFRRTGHIPFSGHPFYGEVTPINGFTTTPPLDWFLKDIRKIQATQQR